MIKKSTKLSYLYYAALALTSLISPTTFADTNTTLLKHLTMLASPVFQGRYAGVQSLRPETHYLNTHFRALSEHTEVQTFTFKRGFFSEAYGHNVIAHFPCTQKHCLPSILVSAHYDHLGVKNNTIYYGANDNASGVAAMLYIMNSVSKIERAREVVFIATDAEEQGLRGAKHHASTLDKSKVALNINLDMLAPSKNKKRLFALFSPKTHTFRKQLSALKQPPLKLHIVRSVRQIERYIKDNRIDWHRASDHYAYYRKGIPYLYFGIGDDKNHHTKNDTVENLDIKSYVEIVTFINDFIVSLVSSPSDSTKRTF